MSKNTITIEFDETGMSMVTEKPATLAEMLQVLLQSLSAAISHFIEEKDPTMEDEKLIRKELFDLLNAGCSRILESIDPESANNPNLTEVAILLAENEILSQAKNKGLSVEEYLPIAKAEQQKKLQKLKEKEKREK